MLEKILTPEQRRTTTVMVVDVSAPAGARESREHGRAVSSAEFELKGDSRRAARAGSVPEVLGVEGSAAARYFQGLGAMLHARSLLSAAMVRLPGVCLPGCFRLWLLWAVVVVGCGCCGLWLLRVVILHPAPWVAGRAPTKYQGDAGAVGFRKRSRYSWDLVDAEYRRVPEGSEVVVLVAPAPDDQVVEDPTDVR